MLMRSIVNLFSNKIIGEEKYMKFAKNKTMAITIALILMFAIATSMIVMPTGQAVVELPTFLRLTVNPNPAGVGQTVYVNAFTTNPPPTGGANMKGDRWENMTVEVTRPDGTKETLGPYHGDSTGGIFVSYVPATTGNYTFQAFFPGQTLTGQNPYYPGVSDVAPWLIGTHMQGSESKIVTFVVQEQPATNVYMTPPLPTEYWSRPIYATNYAWAALGGSWFGAFATAGNLAGGYDATGPSQLYSTAPNTGHIVWTKPTSFGGQVGAPMPGDQNSGYYGVTRGVYEWEPIIISGILYYADYPNYNVISNWVAVDLRTGKTLWTKEFPDGTTNGLQMGQVLNQHTATGYYGSAAYLWDIVGGLGGSTFKIYEPLTGMYLANITGVQAESSTSYVMDFGDDVIEKGTVLGYLVSGGYLRMWNATQLMAYPAGYKTVDVSRIDWSAGSYNWSAGLGKPGGWSVLLPTTLNGNDITLSIAAVSHEVILMLYTPTPGRFVGGYPVSVGWQVAAGYDARTGDKLWGPINQTLPYGQVTSVLCARDGVYVLHNKDTDEMYAYSLTTGKLLWGPVTIPSNAWSTLMRTGDIAYGNVYIWDYGGYVTALDLQTGKIKWTYTPRNAGTDTAFGIYPIWTNTGTIADGKIFLGESHLYTTPMYMGAQRLVINATTGELVWSISSYAGKSYGAIADGMMVQLNSYDKQIYTFGKGQTATTATIQNNVMPYGDSVLITGTVTDQSPGTKNADRIARFPDGVPAVSDASMSEWMEYVYMQQPKPTNATGVPVSIDVIDSNGNYRNIGTTTSDSSGMFRFAWKPDIEGTYTVIATFTGSESYYPSYSETSFAVDSAAPTASPYPVVNLPPTEMYIAAAAAAIIIAIAIATALILLRLRKQPKSSF